jgi:hypothetical protein
MKIILVKMDVTKIDKNRLFKGAKGTYLDFALMEHDQPDQYGNDFMVVQSVSKEERLKGARGAILGNGKYAGGKPARTQTTQTASQAGTTGEPPDDDVPF